MAARAAKRARSGGWGGGAWVGPARSKKEGWDDRLLPPPTAFGEIHRSPAGQSHRDAPVVPVLRRSTNTNVLSLLNPGLVARNPTGELRFSALVFDEPT